MEIAVLVLDRKRFFQESGGDALVASIVFENSWMPIIQLRHEKLFYYSKHVQGMLKRTKG